MEKLRMKLAQGLPFMHVENTTCNISTGSCPKCHPTPIHTVHVVTTVRVLFLLTGNDGQDDQDYDEEDDPQLYILPPQLPPQTSRSALKHAGTLPH